MKKRSPPGARKNVWSASAGSEPPAAPVQAKRTKSFFGSFFSKKERLSSISKRPDWLPEGVTLDPFGTAWMAYARLVEEFEVDVGFETPAYCPNWLLPVGAAPVRVMQPDLPLLFGHVVRGVDAEAGLAALIAYYRRMPDMPPPTMRMEIWPYNLFEVNILIFEDGASPISVDMFQEGWRGAARVLRVLAERESDGVEIYDNQDEGWGLRILSKGDDVFVLAWNPDFGLGGVELAERPLRFSRAALAAKAAGAAARLERIHAALLRGVGRELWESARSRERARDDGI